MRVFDIEKTCVCENFDYFKKPIRAIKYSPTGELLVTCCEDGNVALHNAKRQHLPTKVINLQFPPEFVHVCFSSAFTRPRQATNAFNRPIQAQELNNMGGASTNSEEDHLQMDDDDQDANNFSNNEFGEEDFVFVDSLFGLVGEYGNCLMIYSSDSIVLRHKITVGTVIRSFQFTKNNKEIIIVTKD